MNNKFLNLPFRNSFLVICLLFVHICLYGQITTTTIYSDKSVSVANNTNTPNGSSNALGIGSMYMAIFPSGSVNWVERTLVHVDVSGINPNAIITSANLRFTQSSSSATVPQITTARTATSWNENLVIWSNQPSVITDDQISSSSFFSGVLSIDVKNHVQKMVANVYTNHGWLLRGSLTDESGLGSATRNRILYSDDYSVLTSRPRLEISYYLPMSVASATVSHESQLGANDGSISPVLTNGPGGTYTYNWINSSGNSISTSLNLTGVAAGWYGLQVSSSIAGTTPFYYAFLVGRNCAVIPIEFNPGPNYIDDAVLQGPSSSATSFQNYGSDGFESALDQVLFTTPLQWKTPIRFRLWIDPTLNLNTATLRLKGAHNQSDRSNASIFRRITSNWNENIVTYSSTPTISNDITLNIPELISPTEEKFLNILDFCEYWQQNNNQNFGFLFELQSYNGVLATHRYYSSDVAAVNRPKIDFLVGFSEPVAPHYCNQTFAKMDRNLRGVRYKPDQNHLYFYYEEEYNSPDVGLNYRVYADNNPMTTLIGHTTHPLTEIEYGDNRYVLNISQLPSGFYILEITNNKKEKYYLRFKIED